MQKNTAHQKEESNVLKQESMPNVADQNHIQTNMRGNWNESKKAGSFFRSI